MPELLVDRVPTGGSVVAPRFEDADLDAATEVGAPRQLVPTARERRMGAELRYTEAVRQKPPEHPPLMDQVRQFIRDMDPRELSRDAPLAFWTIAITQAYAVFDLTQTLGPEIQQDIGI